MAWSLLIRGGSVVDGSGAPARRADVAVEGERIAAVAATGVDFISAGALTHSAPALDLSMRIVRV